MITSENLRIDYLQSVGIFEGNVLVIDPRITVRADKMTVTFSKGDAPETASKSVSGTNSTSRSLEKIEATGAVVITEKDRKTQSEHAIYTASDGKVVLTGNPQVESPVGTVTGNKITFWLNEQRMDVESSTRTIFYPDEVKEKNEPTSVGDATDPVDKPTDIDTSPPKPLEDKEKPE